MPTVTFLGPFFERPMRHGIGVWTRGKVNQVTQEWVNEWRHTLPASHFLIEGEEEVTTDAGDDGLPDTGWSRKDILAWMNTNDISTGSGYLTKTAALKLIEKSLSEVEDTTKTTGDEQ